MAGTGVSPPPWDQATTTPPWLFHRSSHHPSCRWFSVLPFTPRRDAPATVCAVRPEVECFAGSDQVRKRRPATSSLTGRPQSLPALNAPHPERQWPGLAIHRRYARLEIKGKTILRSSIYPQISKARSRPPSIAGISRRSMMPSPKPGGYFNGTSNHLHLLRGRD